MNGFILNPAMAGYDGYTSLNTTVRQQWLGFEGAPLTYSATWQTRLLRQSYRIVQSPVRKENMLLPSTKGRVGLGAYIINDDNANVAKTGIQFTYAYHILMNNNQLSFGIAAKAYQYRIKEEDLVFGEDGDPVINGALRTVGYCPDADIGVFWWGRDFFLGASASNLFQSALKIGSTDLPNFKTIRHYWFMGGYKFKVGEELQIEPNFLFKTSEQFLPQGDFGIKVYYNEDYWAGLAGRTDGSLILLFGMKANQVYIGYAFDYALSEIRKFNYGSHELSLSIKFGTNARRYRWLNRY